MTKMCFFNNFHKLILNNIDTHIIFITKFFDLFTLHSLYSCVFYDLPITGETSISTGTQQRRCELCDQPCHPHSGFSYCWKGCFEQIRTGTAQSLRLKVHPYCEGQASLPGLFKVCGDYIKPRFMYDCGCQGMVLWPAGSWGKTPRPLLSLSLSLLSPLHPFSLSLHQPGVVAITHTHTQVHQLWNAAGCLGCCASTEKQIRCVLTSCVTLLRCGFFFPFSKEHWLKRVL